MINFGCYCAELTLDPSPYAASSVKLFCQDRVPLIVPSSLLRKIPKLDSSSTWSNQHSRHLESISQDVGHVIVHHLYTDTYQSLRPKGSSPHEKLVSEFTTSVRVYAAARSYELQSLEELAKTEIERLGDRLHFSVVLNLMQSAYPNPNADYIWLSGYLKSRLKTLCENPAELLQCEFLNTDTETLSISDILLRNLLDLLRENTALHQKSLAIATTQAQAQEDSATDRVVPILELRERGGQGPEPGPAAGQDLEYEMARVEEEKSFCLIWNKDKKRKAKMQKAERKREEREEKERASIALPKSEHELGEKELCEPELLEEPSRTGLQSWFSQLEPGPAIEVETPIVSDNMAMMENLRMRKKRKKQRQRQGRESRLKEVEDTFKDGWALCEAVGI